MITKSTTKLFVNVILFCLILAMLPVRAMAWSTRGHKIVARIAWKSLNQTAKDEVKELLRDDETLTSIALWADEIRGSYNAGGQRPETKMWHFVDIPIDQPNNPMDYCPRTPYGDCVVAAILGFNEVLIDPKKGQYQNSRYEALKFLVHFVGDMHQPLHCAEKNHDGGGNKRKAKWFGEAMTPDNYPWNLHAIWDDGIIDHAIDIENMSSSDWSGYADKLIAALSTEQKNYANSTNSVSRDDIIGWAKDSHLIARNGAYNGVSNDLNAVNDLGKTYFDAHRTQVDEQLKWAGVRLARLINAALK